MSKGVLQHLIQVSASGIDHPYFAVADSSKMRASAICYPPLGRETVIPAGQENVQFKVAIEAEDLQAERWEVQLWHNFANELSWEETPLKLCDADAIEACGSQVPWKWFSGSLPGKPTPHRPVSFTIRLRRHAEQNWKWIRDHSGAEDGKLIYQTALESLGDHDNISTYLSYMSSDLNVESVRSDTPNTRVWSITSKATPAVAERSGFTDTVLGLPNDYLRWFSLVRLWSPWLAPRQGKGATLAEKDAVLYSFLRKDGLHLVVLAISGIDDVLTVFRHAHGKVIINARNDRETEGVSRVVVAVGKTFEEANSAAIYKARHIVEPYLQLSREEKEIADIITNKKDKLHASWIQDWYDGFTYCTWNGLGQNLTEEKISGALKSLKQAGIVITNLIIDDNWQSLDNEGENQMVRGWTEFEANPKGFPKGMKYAISNIREKYPEIKHIAVWHALLGYWGGISPDGKIAKGYKTVEVTKRDDVAGGKMTVVDASDARRMYDDFYSFLSSTGIDAVKTDAQFFIDEIDTAPARRSLTSTYLNAWTSAQLRHFHGHAISCMSQTPSILFPCQLPQSSPAIPVRNSDDFFPDVEESHPWHIFCNAHNSLLTQHLNVLPDWDMFQTGQKKWAGFHGAARAVSGGPIYITDEPGKHDLKLISELTATTTRGQTVILRPSVFGRSVHAYVGFEDESFVQVQSYDGAANTGSAFLGLWNCRQSVISELIPLTNFMGVEVGNSYVIRNHRTGISRLVKYSKGDVPVLPVTLEGHEWALYTLRPLHGPFKLSGNHSLSVSNFGLIGKMTGAVAIVRQDFAIQAGASPSGDTKLESSIESAKSTSARLKISTTLKALGKLGIWISNLDDIDLKTQTFALIKEQPIPFPCVSKSKEDSSVLEIDAERAWKELGLSDDYMNEVTVDIYIS